jgi:hypothetical protein
MCIKIRARKKKERPVTGPLSFSLFLSRGLRPARRYFGFLPPPLPAGLAFFFVPPEDFFGVDIALSVLL